MPDAGDSKLKKTLSIVGASAALLVLAIVVLRSTLLALPIPLVTFHDAAPSSIQRPAKSSMTS